jgi:hypothetical protein
MDRAGFLKYIDHFNHRRYDAVTGYFAPDITVEYYDDGSYSGPPARTLHGRDEFTASYKSLHEHTREVLELGDFIASGNLMFVELWTEFHTFQDSPPNYPRAPKKKGEVLVTTNWVLYTMKGDVMQHIRIAHFRVHDPKLAKFA